MKAKLATDEVKPHELRSLLFIVIKVFNLPLKNKILFYIITYIINIILNVSVVNVDSLLHTHTNYGLH